MVDLHQAATAVGDILDAWWACCAWPDAPPFTGGVLDAWPKRVSDGLAVCRREWAAVTDYLRWQAMPKKGAKNHG